MTDDRKIRRFLETALASALDLGLLDESELVATIGADRLIEHVSVDARTKLLAAFLEADEVTAELLVRTLGIATFAGNAPATLLWRAVSIAGRRAAGQDVNAPDLSKVLEVKVGREAKAKTRAKGTSPGEPAPERKKKSVELFVDDSEDRRKPNRRATGAGATSRRRSRESTPPPPGPNDSPTKSMFVASRRGSSSHRAATEPAFDDIAEIEVIDETEVEVTPSTNGKRK